MPRPKGSKNRKAASKNTGFEAQISEKTEAKAVLEAEQDGLVAVITENNAKLKEVKKQIKALDRQILALEAKKAEADAAAAAELMQEEVQKRVAALVAEGKTLDDILDKLK